MKGIVFTEFIEMMEEEIGVAEAQELLDSLWFENRAAYTAVGDYPFEELLMIVTKYCQVTQRAVKEVLETFGAYFGQTIYHQYRTFFDNSPTLFDFLASVHGYIHVEVRKLYPTARPPELHVQERTESLIKLHYKSDRKLSDFARGLIFAVADVYQTRIHLKDEFLNETGTEVLFTISIQNDN